MVFIIHIFVTWEPWKSFFFALLEYEYLTKKVYNETPSKTNQVFGWCMKCLPWSEENINKSKNNLVIK
jgi:hypothetical protein